MPDASPQFESADLLGSSEHFNGTVGTTATAVPTVAGGIIAEVLLKNPKTNASSVDLLVSFDGGTTFFTIEPRTGLSWSVRGSKTQIHIKGSAAGTNYEILMNREPA